MDFSRPTAASSLLLTACACTSALLAACGPSPEPTTPQTPTSDAKTVAAEQVDAAQSGSTAEEAPKERTESSPIKQSALITEVANLGFDINKLEPLDKMTTGKKKKLMPLFQKALGYKDCGGCHSGSDGVFNYKEDTKNVKMARNMWNHYVVELRDEKGGALFCDSCHDNDAQVLARGDKDKLSTFMEQEYEAKLTRADGEEHSCSTCHTDVFEPRIFKDVWGIE